MRKNLKNKLADAIKEYIAEHENDDGSLTQRENRAIVFELLWHFSEILKTLPETTDE